MISQAEQAARAAMVRRMYNADCDCEAPDEETESTDDPDNELKSGLDSAFTRIRAAADGELLAYVDVLRSLLGRAVAAVPERVRAGAGLRGAPLAAPVAGSPPSMNRGIDR